MLSLFESVTSRNLNKKKQQENYCECNNEGNQYDRFQLKKDYASISLDILQNQSQTSTGHHLSKKTNISIAHDDQLVVVTEKKKSISLYNATLNGGFSTFNGSNLADDILTKVQPNDSLISDDTSYYSAQSSPVQSPISSPRTPSSIARFAKDPKPELSQNHELALSTKKFPPSNLSYCSATQPQTPSRRSVTFSSTVTTTTFQSPILERKPPISKISFTPDGLKPRSSVDEIRAMLRLPTASLAGLPPFDPKAVPISKTYSLMNEKKTHTYYSDDDDDVEDDEDSSNEFSHSLTDISPIRVHSSIESHSISSFTLSALSPRITRGSAMTAVGALVADTEASLSKYDHSFLSYNSSSIPFDEYSNHSLKDSLNSFSKKHKKHNLHDENNKQITKSINVLPPKEWMIQDNSNGISSNSKSWMSEAYHSTNRLYDYGNYTINSSESPDHSRSLSSERSADDSPSSFSYTWKYYEKSYERLPDIPHPSDESPTLMKTFTDLNATYTSRHGLFDDYPSFHDTSKRGTYDFNFIDGSHMRNHIKSKTKSKNLLTQPEFIVTDVDENASQMSSMSTITTFTFDHSVASNIDKDKNSRNLASNNIYSSSSEKYEDSLPELSEFVLDKSSAKERYKKTKKKETILIELVQRLQDDSFLIIEVEDVRENMDTLAGDISIKGKESFFIKTPIDQDGIIMGYQRKQIVKLRESLKRFILKLEDDHIHEVQAERENSISEEDTKSFQISGKIHTMDESNVDLIRALRFVSSAVKTAVKKNDNGSNIHGISYGDNVRYKWRANKVLREAIDAYKLSIDSNGELSSPNSMWNSPSKSITPNTSNRSNTTSLTSSKISSMNESQNINDPNKLRKTLEVVAALLQKMSLACSKIMIADQSSKDTFILATEELKRCYLQLMTIRTLDLYALHSCFVQQNNLILNEAPQTFKQNEIDVPILHNPPAIIRALNSSKVTSANTQPQQTISTSDDKRADIELCSKMSFLDIVSSKYASLIDLKSENGDNKFDSSINDHVPTAVKVKETKNNPNNVDEKYLNNFESSKSFDKSSVIKSLDFSSAAKCDQPSSQATNDRDDEIKIDRAEHKDQSEETNICMIDLIEKLRRRHRDVNECEMEKNKFLNIDDNRTLTLSDQRLNDVNISSQSSKKQSGKSNPLKEIEINESTCHQMKVVEERESNESSMLEIEMKTNMQIGGKACPISNDAKAKLNKCLEEEIILYDVADKPGTKSIEINLENFRQDQNTSIPVGKERRDSNPTIDSNKANIKESNLELMNDVCKYNKGENNDSFVQTLKCAKNNGRRYFAVENECIPR